MYTLLLIYDKTLYYFLHILTEDNEIPAGFWHLEEQVGIQSIRHWDTTM